MDEDSVVGKWGAFESQTSDGNVKTYKKPRYTFIFEKDGTGVMRVFFFKVKIRWEIREKGIALINVDDGTTQLLIPMSDTKLGFEDGKGNIAYLTKMD